MTRRLALFVGLLLASLPATALAHGGTEVSVQGSVRADGPIELTGEEFAGGDVVRVVLRRAGTESLELGRVSVEANGEFRATLHVPASAPAGLYVLAVEGAESATTEVTILAPAEGAPAAKTGAEDGPVSNDRRADEAAGLAIFTVASALAGVAVLWRFREGAIGAS